MFPSLALLKPSFLPYPVRSHHRARPEQLISFHIKGLFKRCHLDFWLVKDCLYLQGETETAPEHHPGQRVGVWMKLDLCFVSSIFSCLQRLFARWQEISDSRLENKPRLPCFLSWMGRTGSDFSNDTSMCRHSPEWIAGAWEAAAVAGSDPWGGTTGTSELPVHLHIQPSWSRDLHPLLC